MQYSTATSTIQTECLQVRVSPETKMLIERAASLQDVSVSDFLANVAYDAATRALIECEGLELDARDSQIFFDAIINPPEASEVFQRAARRYIALHTSS